MGDADGLGDPGNLSDTGDFREVVVELEITLNFVGEPKGDGDDESEGEIALPIGFNGRLLDKRLALSIRGVCPLLSISVSFANNSISSKSLSSTNCSSSVSATSFIIRSSVSTKALSALFSFRMPSHD
jgi:hypothetical protein